MSDIDMNQVLSDIDSGEETEVVLDDLDDSSISSDESKGEEKTPVITPLITGIIRATQTETPYCGICYTDLSIENNVTTKCNHHFCNKCFFRWIEVNATCPSCRAPIDSNTNLTDEQLHRENKEVYQDYMELLSRYSHQLNMNKKKFHELLDLRKETGSLLKRQITLREQIQETEGYNEGYMAAAYEFFHGDNKMKDTPILRNGRMEISFMNGYRAGRNMESRRLNKLARKLKLRPRRKIKIKRRKIQKTLWDCGIINNDDVDPLSRITVGLSTDEDEDEDEDEDDEVMTSITI
jgi:hypothetical protein